MPFLSLAGLFLFIYDFIAMDKHLRTDIPSITPHISKKNIKSLRPNQPTLNRVSKNISYFIWFRAYIREE